MFWWLIWMLVFVFLAGSDARDWSSVWTGRRGRRLSTAWGRHLGREQADYDLHQELLHNSIPDVVVVGADDPIDEPDIYIDKLIEHGELDRAREYRIEMERMAEQQNNDELMRKYAIYGARIARRQKELSQEERKKQYYAQSDAKPAKKEPVVVPINVITTPEMATVENDPFITPPAKPPLWSAKTGKSTPIAERISHLDIKETITGPVMPRKPEIAHPTAAQVPPAQPVEPVPKPEYKPAPSPEYKPEYKPGPVDTKPPAEKEVPKKILDPDAIDPDEYGDLISI